MFSEAQKVQKKNFKWVQKLEEFLNKFKSLKTLKIKKSLIGLKSSKFHQTGSKARKVSK